MDYAALYQKKLTSAAEAVKVVKSGDWVDYGWCTNHPYTLDKALAARQNELKDVKVRGGLVIRPRIEVVEADPEQESFSYYSWHVGIAAASTARLSPRAWAISFPCATASCRASTATATPQSMLR